MTDIKPCPFCSSADVRGQDYLHADAPVLVYWLECWGCGSKGPEFHFDHDKVDKSKAIDLWNGPTDLTRLQRAMGEAVVLVPTAQYYELLKS